MSQGPARTTPAFVTPAIVLGTAAAAGSTDSLVRSDSTIAAFDATAPTTQAFGDAAAVGAAAFAARRDHKHGMPAGVVLANLPSLDRCRVTHTVNQSINNATWTALAFDTERYDVGGLHDTVTNNTRITIVTAGPYAVVAAASFAGNVTGIRGIRIMHQRGATTTQIAGMSAPGLTGISNDLTCTAYWEMQAADYVYVEVIQTSTVALNISKADAFSPEFMVALLGKT